MNAVISESELDRDRIIERMQSVRVAGENHLEELQGEAKRLVDWKEYVRSKPFLCVAAATLFGFGLVRKTVHVIAKPYPSHVASMDRTKDTKSFRSSVTSTVATLAVSIASNAIKKYIATLIQRGNSEGESNDRLRYIKSRE